MGEKHRTFDRWGMGLSSFCAIHCLLGSLFVFVMPAFAQATDSVFVHLALFLLVVPIAFIALHRSWRSHRKSLPIILAIIGVLFLGVDLLLEMHIFSAQHSVGVIFSLIGSLFLFSAHLKNFRICHRH